MGALIIAQPAGFVYSFCESIFVDIYKLILIYKFTYPADRTFAILFQSMEQ
jgi:hypothetical protein